MRKALRPVVVGVALLGLAGVGAGSAQAEATPLPKTSKHHSTKVWHKDVTKIWEKEIDINKSILFGPMIFS